MSGTAVPARSEVAGPVPGGVPSTTMWRAWGQPLALYAVIAAVVGGPAVAGRAALGPDGVLDADSLYGALPGDVIPVHNDPTPVVLDLPRDLEVARGLRQGRLFNWNPRVACGAPLWAEQGGPFFPLKLVFYLHPSRATHHLFLTLRLVLAALGAMALARRRGLSFGAALLVGALFEVSGSLFAHLPFAVASAVFMLPWVLLCAQLLVEARGAEGLARATALSALVVGTTAHSGHPTLSALVLLAFALASLGHAVETVVKEQAPGRAALALVCAGLAGLLGLALAGPVLLPLQELASVGRTYKDTAFGESIWQGDLTRFRSTTPLALFAPHLLGALRSQLDVLFPYLFAPSLGLLALTLGVAGALGGALALPLALPAILGLLLGLMPPGFGWVHQVPVLRLIMPQYPWALVQLPLLLCAGAALDQLASGRARLALAVAAMLVVAGSGTLALAESDPYQQFDLPQLRDRALGEVRGLVRLLVPLAAVAGVGIVALASRAPSRGRAVALGIGAFVELAAITVPKTRLPVSHVLDREPTAAVRYLADRTRDTQSRFTAMPYKVGFPNTPMLFGLDDFREVSALPVSRYLSYLSTIGPPVGFTVQAVDRLRATLYDVAAVRWFVVRSVATAPPEPNLGRQPMLPLRWSDPHVAVYENLTALPRYRISHEMRLAPSRDVALYFVWGVGNPSGAVQSDGPVSVEADERGEFPAPLTGGRANLSESVRRVDDGSDPDRLVLEARLDRDALVVVADTFYPGWEATVDGQPARIHPADEMFRAVRVTSRGTVTHTIEMRYRPRSLRGGLVLFAVGLSAVGLLLLGTVRRRGSSVEGAR